MSFFSKLPTKERIQESQDHIKIIIFRDERVYLGGYGVVQCTSGEIFINGALLTPDNGPLPYFSPKSTSLLYISTSTSERSAELVITELPNGPISLIDGDISVEYTFRFPSSMKTSLQNVYIISESNPEFVAFDISSEWLGVSDALLQYSASVPVVFVVGPRKVGKSSMSRYLCNSLWNKHKKVAFLDLDIGQTEFTPPGCISLTIVDRYPLLGPPMSHQTITEGLFYTGFLSPGENPKMIMRGAKSLITKYLTSYHSNGIPLIVNTMGWVTGLGLSLLQTFFHLLPTTHLVAFSQGDPNPFEYVQTALFEASPFAKPYSANDAPHVAYVNPSEASGTATSRLRRYTPVELRNFTFSAYFLGSYDKNENRVCYPETSGFTFRSAVPLEVSLDRICIVKDSKKIDPHDTMNLMACNLAVAGLAHLNPRFPYPLNCTGLAIIRSIDLKHRKIQIITPFKVEDLESSSINCLVVGGLYLPTSFIQTPENSNGPYISYSGSSLSRVPGASARKARNNISRKYAS